MNTPPGVALDPRVGLEVHVRLGTGSKLFCACPNTADGVPNQATCPVCAGLPGAMPTLNRRAVELGVRAALTLHADVQPVQEFDRKHYAYPDLPKGYQITQERRPLARGGFLALAEGTRVPLDRIHLEEDAGRSRHDKRATLVDLNRAGAPLIEIVSQPTLRSGDEVRDFLTRLREELRFAGVSDCDMEKGHLRCDVNVSLVAPGQPGFARVELKNLNSIRAAGDAVVHEFRRQAKLLRLLAKGRGPGPENETRGWHAPSSRSFAMRGKEHATDYRFLPEPDLPAVLLTTDDHARLEAERPPSARAIRKRWVASYGLLPARALELTKTPGRAAYFEAVVAAGGEATAAAKWITNELAAAARERPELTREGLLAAGALAELLTLETSGRVTRAGRGKVFEAHLRQVDARAQEGAAGTPFAGPSPEALADELGLLRPREDQAETTSAGLSEAELATRIQAALAGNPDAVHAYRRGRVQALDALVGAVMSQASGRADGRRVRAALRLVLGTEPT